MKKILFAIIMIIYFSMNAIAHAASFDCGKAATKIEKMICADSDISALDEQLAVAYKKALSSSANKDELKQEQRGWLSKIRNKCQESTCFKQAYLDRIIALAGVTAEPVAQVNTTSATSTSTTPAPSAESSSASFEEALEYELQAMLKLFRNAKNIKVHANEYLTPGPVPKINENPPVALKSFCNRLLNALKKGDVKAPVPVFSANNEKEADEFYKKVMDIRKQYYNRTLKDGFGPDSLYKNNCAIYKYDDDMTVTSAKQKKRTYIKHNAESCFNKYKAHFDSETKRVSWVKWMKKVPNRGLRFYRSDKLWNGEDGYMFVDFQINKLYEKWRVVYYTWHLYESNGNKAAGWLYNRSNNGKWDNYNGGFLLFGDRVLAWTMNIPGEAGGNSISVSLSSARAGDDGASDCTYELTNNKE